MKQHCSKCDRYTTRRNIVFGEGNLTADLMFVNGSPSFHEDAQGKMFYGKSGDLLKKLIEEINLSIKDIYITNLVKCFGRETPSNMQIETCKEYLKEEIHTVKPLVICTLGLITVMEALHSRDLRMKDIHGKIFKRQGIVIIPSYHPSWVLNNKDYFDILKKDFIKIKKVLRSVQLLNLLGDMR